MEKLTEHRQVAEVFRIKFTLDVFVYKHVVYLNVHRLRMCSKLWRENFSGNWEVLSLIQTGPIIFGSKM